jgi:hypothetical protein
MTIAQKQASARLATRVRKTVHLHYIKLMSENCSGTSSKIVKGIGTLHAGNATNDDEIIAEQSIARNPPKRRNLTALMKTLKSKFSKLPEISHRLKNSSVDWRSLLETRLDRQLAWPHLHRNLQQRDPLEHPSILGQVLASYRLWQVRQAVHPSGLL